MLRTLCTLFLALVALNSVWARTLLESHMPSSSLVLNGYDDIDSVKTAIKQRGPTGIEGLWQMTASQAIVSIEPATYPGLSGAGLSAYQIVFVSSPRKSIRPGTVLGYFVQSGKAGQFDSYMYTSLAKSLLTGHKRFVLTLGNDDRNLTISPLKSRWKATFRYYFNFFIRTYVSNTDRDTAVPEGFVKLYPITGKPLRPVYL